MSPLGVSLRCSKQMCCGRKDHFPLYITLHYISVSYNPHPPLLHPPSFCFAYVPAEILAGVTLASGWGLPCGHV